MSVRLHHRSFELICPFFFDPLIHPLELLSRFHQRLPWSSRWRQFAPAEDLPPEQDWLQEPARLDEAKALFPHLSDEQALLRYQRFRLGMRWNR